MFRFRFCKLIEDQDPSILKEPSCWLTQLSTHILDSVVISYHSTVTVLRTGSCNRQGSIDVDISHILTLGFPIIRRVLNNAQRIDPKISVSKFPADDRGVVELCCGEREYRELKRHNTAVL
jgi:hypothetical protein